MQIDILTIFPNFFSSPLNEGLVKKAQESKLIDIKVTDIRDFAKDKHRSVDDTPFGGGAGMVMMVESLSAALDSILSETPSAENRDKYSIILTSAQGKRFDQEKAKELINAKKPPLINWINLYFKSLTLDQMSVSLEVHSLLIRSRFVGRPADVLDHADDFDVTRELRRFID